MPVPSSIKKVLVVNIFGIGDVLFTTPLLTNIKKNIADAFIGYVVSGRAATILENNPNIDQLYIYDRDEYQTVLKQSRGLFLKKIGELLKLLKKEKYDLLIDLSLNGWVSFWGWSIGIPQRVGFNYKRRGWFLSKGIDFKGYENRHVIEHYLSLLEELGFTIYREPLQLPIAKEDGLWANLFMSKEGLATSDMKIGIVPGGGASWGKDAAYKRWSPQKYAELADKIIENLKTPIILLGDITEKELCEQIANLMRHPVVLACGRTTLGQCSALFKECTLAIVNDGGPLHIAVASGTRTVSIFGPVDENVYGPYPRDNHFVVTSDIACRPCYRQFRRASCEHVSCLNNIEVDDVFHKVIRAFTTVT